MTAIWAICMTRMARLGEFLPVGAMFILSSISKITQVAEYFGLSTI
jgi:hypothetical protein